MERITIAIAQVNQVVGDFTGNCKKIMDYTREAKAKGADIVVFPELSVSGYPPEDLLLRSDFAEENRRGIEQIVKATEDIVAVVGFVRKDQYIYNSAAIISHGTMHGAYDKIFLPNYGVFDEYRYFARGSRPLVFRVGPVRCGVTICEDIWYPDGPYVAEAAAGAEIILNLSASPYHFMKWRERENMIITRAYDTKSFFVYCNMTGGQDELVFDGASLFVGEDGNVAGRLPLFQEALEVQTVDAGAVLRERIHDPRVREEEEGFRVRGGPPYIIEIPRGGRKKKRVKKSQSRVVGPSSIEEEVFDALVVGTGDYVRKNGFTKVVIGLSGGIDSSLVAAIAVEALGKRNVVGVTMPSLISPSESVDDARTLGNNLGISFLTIPIWDIFEGFTKSLAPFFRGKKEDVTEENLQARIRGMILMSLSNKLGTLVLTTGNKSEMSVGYATLYGDMAGGFAVIKDVYKTMVYRLARYYNERQGEPLIPERVLTKEPSAELKVGQKDTDHLPPYEILDPILKRYIEDDWSIDEIVSLGFPSGTVKKVVRMVDSNEYKRRQAPPGIRISQRALGKDRRMPITNRFFGKY